MKAAEFLRPVQFWRIQLTVSSSPVLRPSLEGEGFEIWHLPTHAEHFYDVHRVDFNGKVTISTENNCHVMMLVEGDKVLLETDNGTSHVFAYAETFVVPAAAKSYTLTNLGKGTARVIKAFLKEK